MSFGIFEKLNTMQGSLTTSEASALCSILVASVRKRLAPYELRIITRMGTILDPRFKKEGFHSTTNANEASKNLEQEIAALIEKDQRNDKFTEVQKNRQDESSFFDFVEKRLEGKRVSSRADAIITLRQYFEQQNVSKDTDPLLAWKVSTDVLNPLKNVLPKYFCTPATSVDSERIFSKAGLITTDRRSRLKPKHVDMIIFLNKNDWLLA
ncbi:zinc finger BED domain-containing protein 1-like [Rhagoletis pomonella]|uniref:zinc finger BED domain-containing protein 1-like n=1 Tax=Rhagoletis pomonella TaxID=28610 RepID=UPI00177FE2D7|nr:zinc finger BED domain-containing protein 1-like [Rhagoletis pomonella]